jgi:hypothetical protein
MNDSAHVGKVTLLDAGLIWTRTIKYDSVPLVNIARQTTPTYNKHGRAIIILDGILSHVL